jgi:hypothetical protein
VASKNPEIRKNNNKVYYQLHMEEVKARNKAARKRNQEYLRAAKEEKPCIDCGEWYPYYVMQFDHVRDNKLIDLANAPTRGWSIKKIQAEINKCEIVCANCHAVRTFDRINDLPL